MKFVVLPDGEIDHSLLNRVKAEAGSESVAHPSGRPWILGLSENERLIFRPDSFATVVLVGTPAVLAAIPLAVRHSLTQNTRYREALRCVPDVCHILVSRGGDDVTCAGTLSGDETIFWRQRQNGLPGIASNSVSMLISIESSRMNYGAVALRLVQHLVPADPFRFRTVWEGVRAVRLGYRVRLKADGWCREERVWHSDEGDRQLIEARKEVFDRILASVELRTAGYPRLSADLSGGMDSTSLCFVLSYLQRDYLATRTTSVHPMNDEGFWARKAADELHIDLRELSTLAQTSSAFDTDISTDLDLLAEGPLSWEGTRGLVEAILPHLVAHGSGVHLTGLGGDELFGAELAGIVPGVWQDEGLRALSYMRVARLRDQVSLRQMMSGMFRTWRAASEISRAAAMIHQSAKRSRVSPVPQWLSTGAREAIEAELLGVELAEYEPLNASQPVHYLLQSIAHQGSILRQVNIAFGSRGVRWAAPLTDRDLIETVLSVRMRERVAHRAFKPLLAAAMSDIMPGEYFTRENKGDYTADVYLEHSRKKKSLLEFFDSSLLHEQGFIRIDDLRAALDSPSVRDPSLIGVHNAVAAERWLRGVDTTAGLREGRAGSS